MSIPNRGQCAHHTAPQTTVVVEMTDCCGAEAFSDAEQALVDELRLAQIPVIRAKGGDFYHTAQRHELERIAKSHRAAAAICLAAVGSDGKTNVALLVIDSATHKTLYRRIEIPPSPELSLAMLVAVRTVETLRASFDELTLEVDTMGNDKVAPPPAQINLAHPHSWFRFALTLPLGIAMAPGGAGIRGQMGIEAAVQIVPGLSFAASGDWSPRGGTYTANGVQSRLTYLLPRAWIHYRFLARSLLQPAIGIGSGVFLGKTTATVIDGNQVRDARTLVTYIGSSARVYIHAFDRFSLMFAGTVGMLLPEAKVMHGETQVATLGKPLLELTIGVQYSFKKE